MFYKAILDFFCISLSKYCLKIYLGFCFYSDGVKLPDQETTTIEKIVCYSHFPRSGGRHTMQDHMGRGRIRSGSRHEGKTQAKTFIVFFIGWNRRDRVSKLRRFRVGWFE